MHDDSGAPASVALTDSAYQQAAAHPHRAERELAWARSLSLCYWSIALHSHGYPFGFNAVWITYAGGLAYTLVMHWRLRDRSGIRFTAWFGTIGDPVLIFFMCLVTGGVASIFVPFFYFSVLATAFRYGVIETLGIFVFNAFLLVTVFGLANYPSGDADALLLSLVYLGVACSLGVMMAGWARGNLAIALTQSGALRAERDRSHALLHRLINTQEEERKRAADDIHDRMGARLFTLQHGLDQCTRSSGASPVLQRQLQLLRTEADACGADVRTLMNEMRPTVLDELGLHEALTEYLTNLAEVVPFSLHLQLDPALRKWQSRQDAMLFRLVQEALLNVRKHAEASNVTVGLERRGSEIVLCIEDDGSGFDPTSIPTGHYGLLTMRERAEVAGGRLTIHSELLRGTQVIVYLPADHPEFSHEAHSHLSH